MGDSDASIGFGACCCVSACLFVLLAASLTTTYANRYEQETGLAKGAAEWITWAIVILFAVVSGCFALGGSEGGIYIAAVCGVYCFILLEIFLLICSILVSVSVSRNENLSSTGKSVGISAAVFMFCSMFVALSGPLGIAICIMGSKGSRSGGGGGGVTSRSYQPRHEETAISDHSLTEDQKRQLQAYLNSLTPEQRYAIMQYILAKSRGENPKAPEGMTEEQVQIIIIIAAATN